jgi:hypothetical protein
LKFKPNVKERSGVANAVSEERDRRIQHVAFKVEDT